MSQPPIILCLSGHDPSGGAGLAADREAVAALGGHAVVAVTALTVQDTRDVLRLVPVAADLVLEQARALLADLPVAAIKIGLLGSAAVAAAVARLLAETPGLPVVLDPVLAAGGGRALADDELLETLRGQLLPRVSLLTPNSVEARRLCAAGADAGLDACAGELLATGCGAVLITGGHEDGAAVSNRLYRTGHPPHERAWPRLAGAFHGSGCTLAAACAVLMAQQPPPDLAAVVDRAQGYTHTSLARARPLGRGQWIPQRLPDPTP